MTDPDVAALIQRAQETIPETTVDLTDAEWAIDRVTRMAGAAYADAIVYRKKLLKGFGYPNETFSRAQDARALSIVLTLLTARETAPRKVDLLQQLAGKQCVQCGGSIDAATARCKACDERDAYLEAQVTALEAELQQLDGKLTFNETGTRALQAQKEAADRRIEELETALVTAQQERDKETHRLKLAIDDYNEVKAERDALRDQVAQLQQELDRTITTTGTNYTR